jgi:hypothetical protein
MGSILRLVNTETDSAGRVVDEVEFSQRQYLGNIANLALTLLTLSEGKQLLARAQQSIVAARAQSRAVLRPDCSACGGRATVPCH